ncbi:hypothetical protein H0H92_007307 [Tricholoma furcatifolium]|nr:hypothetical protein H0H92_007307 [Tricholoma furcatifolium]
MRLSCLTLLGFLLQALAFDMSRYDNVAVTGGLPSINLANTCNPTDNATFAGTDLADCSSLASDIATCQAAGKIITISLGGATGSDSFDSDDQATAFAQTIWDLFLGGNSTTRPFGDAVLDGVDLDIESGTGTSFVTFVNELRSLASGASKQYYITAAPQCVFPDAALGSVIDGANFDAIYGSTTTHVDFKHLAKQITGTLGYGTFASSGPSTVQLFLTPQSRDYWARNTSPNPNVKVYIGAPASSTAAGSGYQSIDNMTSIAVSMRESFPSFGGVMLWDASQAYANDRYDLAVKNALVAAGGTGFTFPTCDAPAWSSGASYEGGSTVTFDGYDDHAFQAKWYASDQPASNANSDWSASEAFSKCGGESTTATCSDVAAWNSTTAYVGGDSVVYKSVFKKSNSAHSRSSTLWTAQWWTEGDTPGVADVWVDEGACTSDSPLSAAAEASPSSAANNTASGTKNSRFFKY